MQIEEKICAFDTTKITYSDHDELPYKLQRSVEKIALKEGYLSYEILSRTISTEGGNYMAVLYEVDIKGKTRAGLKETNLFVKYIITAEHINIVDVTALYSNELFFYNVLSKLYDELENEAAVPVNERYTRIKAYDESSEEAIILQNLSKEGFTTLYRMNVIPLKFAEMSVQELAKFHALNMVIEKKRPEFFEKFIKNLKHSIEFGENFRNALKKFYSFSLSVLDSETRRKLDRKFPEYLDKYPKFLKGDMTKVTCLCHGDYRMNNILMKMKGEEITEVVPVDYQLLFYGSPVIDFLYFIFGATDREFRRQHLEHLKELYFNTLENYLKHFDVDINTVYPKKLFEQDYYNCLEYGIHVMLFFGPFFFTLEGEVPDFDKTNLLDMEVNLDHRFQNRLQGTIEEFIEWNRL